MLSPEILSPEILSPEVLSLRSSCCGGWVEALWVPPAYRLGTRFGTRLAARGLRLYRGLGVAQQDATECSIRSVLRRF